MILDFDKLSVHESAEQSPGFLLWQVSTSWRSAIEAVLKTHGLTHPQFVILATTGWLTRNGASITQAAIGKMAKLDPNTTSQVLKGLEQKGWITRAASSDARAKSIAVTAKGAELLREALPAVERADAHFFQALKAQELGQFVVLCHKLQTP